MAWGSGCGGCGCGTGCAGFEVFGAAVFTKGAAAGLMAHIDMGGGAVGEEVGTAIIRGGNDMARCGLVSTARREAVAGEAPVCDFHRMRKIVILALPDGTRLILLDCCDTVGVARIRRERRGLSGGRGGLTGEEIGRTHGLIGMRVAVC